MAQGKAFTPEQREEIVQSLRPYLEMGFSRNKSCAFIGLKANTLSNWVKEDEALGMKLIGWENALSKLALANVHKALKIEAETEDARIDSSWKYLERKEDSFKPKSDVTSNEQSISNVAVTIKSDDDTESTSE